ncbi:MAG: tetratricopeptide repeat protein [Methanomicrobiales archaeon]|nr:tetratricopeptide repeat protein [Methanomicrobiales archaeon]
MTNGRFEEIRRESFRLFEEGRYAESLERCRAAGTATPDPQLAILAARNLFNLGRFDEAEAYTRDLIQKIRVCTGRSAGPDKPGSPPELCRVPGVKGGSPDGRSGPEETGCPDRAGG